MILLAGDATISPDRSRPVVCHATAVAGPFDRGRPVVCHATAVAGPLIIAVRAAP